MRRASTLVLPHKAGTQFDYIPSNKIYDYILAGRPVVAYRTPAVAEILDKYPMRILVEPNNPMALARGIARALELWKDSEPTPMFNCVPTLEDIEKTLRIVYHVISRAEPP